jgi:methanethiol oxidase
MPEIDPTFYRSPTAAVAAAPEQLAYVAAFDPTGQAKDALAVVDCEPNSPTYGDVVGWSELPTAGQRTAPLRLERMLERAVSRRARRPS